MSVTLKSGSTTAPVIDRDHLDRVTFRDLAFRNEVLTLFIREAKALLLRLGTASDEAQWRIAAHSMKGMARGVGAVRLAEAAEQAEVAGRGSSLDRLTPLVAEAIAEAELAVLGA